MSLAGSAAWTALPTTGSNVSEPTINRMVSLQTMLTVREIYQSSSLLEEIRSLLQKSVWSAGMALFREDVGKTGAGNFTRRGHRIPWNPPSHVRETLEDRWEIFKHDLLDSLLCFGFAVVHFTYFKKAGLSVVDPRQNDYPFPTIVAPELYRLMVKTTMHGTQLLAVNSATMEELSDCRVFGNFGYNPSVSGTLNSLVSKSYADVYHLEQLAATAMRARDLRCNPTVFIETQADVKKNEGEAAVASQQNTLAQTLGIAPADNLEAQNVLQGHVPLHLGVNREQRIEADKELFRFARHTLALRRGDFEGAAMAGAPASSSAKPVRRWGVSNGIPLKAGEQAKVVPTPNESGNFPAQKHALMESIAGVFGVPLGVLKGSAFSSTNRGVGVANTRVVHAMYRLTVNEWRRRVSDVLTKCFGECYYELLAKEKMTGETTQDILAEKRRRLIQVSFHPTTFVDNDDLRELYEWGCISWETFSSYCMTNSSLPIEEREKKPPSPNPLGIGLPSPEQLSKPAGEPSKPSKPNKAKEGGDSKKKLASKAPKRKEASSSSSSSSKEEPAKKKAKASVATEPQKVIVQIQTK